jgi:hypothetical protein
MAVATGKAGEPALVEVKPASLYVAQQKLCLPSGSGGSALQERPPAGHAQGQGILPRVSARLTFPA